MSVEIHQPEIEALIEQRMASGAFQDVEELLIHALRSAPPSAVQAQTERAERAQKQSLDEFLRQSPLWDSGLVVERQKDYPRPVDL